MQIDALVADVLAYVKDTRSPLTARSYATGIGRFVDFLEAEGIGRNEDANRIRYNHFVGFFRHLRSRDVKKSTIHTYIQGVLRLLTYGIAWDSLEMTERDLFKIKLFLKDAIRRQERGPQLPRVEWSAVQRMIDAASMTAQASPLKERDEALVKFLASTGCRVSGAAGLKIADVNLGDKSAIVTEKRKSRTVYFSESAKEALLHYWSIRGNDNASSPAFSRHDKRMGGDMAPLTTVSLQNIIRRIAEEAGFAEGEFTPHTFRHAFATRMLDETGNLAHVQELLGHANPTVTRIYAKSDPGQVKDAYREVFD